MTNHTNFAAVKQEAFQAAFSAAYTVSPLVSGACSPAETAEGGSHYLSTDTFSGFRVTTEGDLTHVFSLVKGRGASIIGEAKQQGAVTLDCFEGYLTHLYSQHGFAEYRREANWTAGEPDVVFMRLQ